ncbi:unnamed protein product [Closterium sp. NIES-64]|nr:unnamed protein product [Closterium sp. NIES-64]
MAYGRLWGGAWGAAIKAYGQLPVDSCEGLWAAVKACGRLDGARYSIEWRALFYLGALLCRGAGCSAGWRVLLCSGTRYSALWRAFLCRVARAPLHGHALLYRGASCSTGWRVLLCRGAHCSAGARAAPQGRALLCRVAQDALQRRTSDAWARG